MGCQYHTIQHSTSFYIPEQDNDLWACLCTFDEDSLLDAATIRSLAALGVAQVLTNKGVVLAEEGIVTPWDLPIHMKDQLDALKVEA